MKEQFCLKSDYNLLNVNAVEKELWANGISTTYRGVAKSYDGEYQSNVVVNEKAFYIVCDLLCQTRQELAAAKKRKFFWMK